VKAASVFALLLTALLSKLSTTSVTVLPLERVINAFSPAGAPRITKANH